MEGDRIALVGDRAKGWQFGENLRTHTFGWFPVAYTELEQEDNHNNWGAPSARNGYSQSHQQQQHHHHHHQPQQQQQSNNRGGSGDRERDHHQQQQHSNQHLHSNAATSSIDQTPDSSLESTVIDEPIPLSAQVKQQLAAAYQHGGDDASPTRMFGDTIMYRQSKQFRRVSGGITSSGGGGGAGGGPKPGPPPTLPAPVPTPVVPASYPSSAGAKSIPQSQSFSTATPLSNAEKRKSMPPMSTSNYNSKQV